MIHFAQQVFHLATNNTSYLIGIRNNKYIENLYYGNKIKVTENYEALQERFGTGYGNSVGTPDDAMLTLDNLCLEYSFGGNGDYRHSPFEIRMPDYSYSNRFYYQSHEIYEGTFRENEETKLPYARYGEDATTLEIVLHDQKEKMDLILVYTVFPSCDVITRRTILKNNTDSVVRVERMMSLQLDLPEADYDMETFDGSWTRERHATRKHLESGVYVNESTTGSSSNRHNPLILVEKRECTEMTGACIGVNLLYSGNHYEAVEVTPYGKIRILTGIHPHRFEWFIKPEETFYTPEAVLTYSSKGRHGVTAQFGTFVNQHIIPKQWQKRERPVLINNWEATYFDFTERKLLKLAKEAANLGIELFVLDDGWFGKREDDSSSLGDWFVNEKKLGGSLRQLSNKIHDLGLQFGIWMEPEMISENSELYREHPDWAVRIPNRDCYVGRNQYVLDLTRQEVRAEVVGRITEILRNGNVQYVKWDMNRHLSDAYSASLGERQGEFYHRYILGVYEMMKQITEEFPDILFESCSAGGNRFDLGMLYYMPQIWTSDDTDANERVAIQEGTSCGYPLSTMGAHVSAVPNHQTLRSISIESRFNVACFGVLGYELDLTKLSMSSKKIVKEQIAFYKKYRALFQFGSFTKSRMHNGNIIWQVVSEDKQQAIAMCYQQLQKPNTSSDILKVIGLDPEQLYHVEARKQAISIKQFGDLVNQASPVPIKEEGILQTIVNQVYTLESESESYDVYGDLLELAGIKLKQQFVSTGYNEETRVMGDFSSRIYLISSKAL
ncbi:alpha-galactosidase [Anaerosporobacter faecicola]|uniref:alpha-galactosidase n=1 Tax=Anaerosporobacter faecicola TaxID=2718714 RepID=UPI00143A76D1|nr:alpha-galactosidase [Anaerosporobacter faecicola]